MGPGPLAPGPEPPQFFRRRILLAFLVLALIYAVVTFVVPTYVLELPLGLFTLLLAPGYAVGSLVLGPKPRWAWSLMVPLVVGLSVAINVALGLLLLAAGWGLPPTIFALVSLALLLGATFFWPANAGPEAAPRFRPFLREELSLPGHSPPQRTLAYGLLLAIVFVLVVIIYFASVAPSQTAQITFGITGAGGTNLNLPPHGTLGQNLSIWVLVGNNGSYQQLTVVVESMLNNSTPQLFTTTNWTSPAVPLSLGNYVRASDVVLLTPGESLTLKVHFAFAKLGGYNLFFLLETSGGQLLRQASWSLVIY